MEQALGRLIDADLTTIKGNADAAAGALPVLPASPMQDDPAPGADFTHAMSNAIRGVDAKEHAAADQMNAVDSGRSDDLVGAMLASQDASLSFSMLMQVRNKVMGAVDDLMKLPI